MIGPVSQPGPPRQSARLYGIGVARDDDRVVVLLRAVELVGKLLVHPHAVDLARSADSFCVDHVRPPSVEMFAPPSFDWIMMLPSFGLIQMSWLSPCGVRIVANVLPPSVDLQKPSAPA